MADQAHLDRSYFIDDHVYNCPFCNRRNVSYRIVSETSFDWTPAKRCYVFIVGCDSCGNQSMHLTFTGIKTYAHRSLDGSTKFSPNASKDGALDEAFFYSVPTSFFTIDDRVPRVLRDLLTEAQGCLKSNYLTGASACARKIVYELAVLEKGTGDSYEDRIKSLKTVHSKIEPEFFDTLLTIQQVASTKVHEDSYDGWEAKHLRVILASLSEVLHEIYVVPAVREDRRKSILDLKSELIDKPKKPKPAPAGPDDIKS